MFSHSYFLRELHAFMQEMGKLSFWRLSEGQRENALKGLLYCYTHTEESDTAQEETRGNLMRMATDDYTRRSMYMPFHPKLQEAA